jgi:hypothetical protein
MYSKSKFCSSTTATHYKFFVMKTKDKSCEIDEIPHKSAYSEGVCPEKAKLVFAALRTSPAVLSMIGPSLKNK